MRAIRSLGVVKDEAKKDYELVDTTKTIAVVFGDGAKTLVIGGRVHGGSDRYVLDVDTGKGFVLAGTLITPLEGGEGSLRPLDLRAFDPKAAMQVEIAAGGKTKTVHRIKVKQPAGDGADPHAAARPEQEVETWGQGATADTAAANFIDKVEKLRPTSFEAKLDAGALTSVVTLTYRDGKGKALGTMQVLKQEKPGEAPPPPPPGAEPPPPPPPVVEYYLLTERTRGTGRRAPGRGRAHRGPTSPRSSWRPEAPARTAAAGRPSPVGLSRPSGREGVSKADTSPVGLSRPSGRARACRRPPGRRRSLREPNGELAISPVGLSRRAAARACRRHAGGACGNRTASPSHRSA
ncbi:MAG: hypothetical protein HS111_29395 [Kofleriaceae bacterium]|nr:hypothetical protein [Kofleriaceae bacterium]